MASTLLVLALLSLWGFGKIREISYRDGIAEDGRTLFGNSYVYESEHGRTPNSVEELVSWLEETGISLDVSSRWSLMSDAEIDEPYLVYVSGKDKYGVYIVFRSGAGMWNPKGEAGGISRKERGQ